MPHRSGFITWITDAWGQLGTTVQSLIILIATLAGRTIYKGGRLRQFIGEAIILAVVLSLITPRITARFPDMSPAELSAVLGLGGLHLLRWLVNKKTGITIPSGENQ